MAEAEVQEKVDQFSYMCVGSMTLDEVEQATQKWRKRGKDHEAGDWIMACPEPLQRGQKEQKYTWIAGPEKVGKGGPDVACHAAWVALMHGRAFDIDGDFSKKSEHKKAALAKEATEWPVLSYKNGKSQKQKPMEDSDDEDEELLYYGTPCVFAVRYKSNIYTADTMSDSNALNPSIRMVWSGIKDPLCKAFGMQAKFHSKTMDETALVSGLDAFKALAKAHKDNLA